MCFAVAENVVVSGSTDRTLCVWRRDGAKHVCLAVLARHTGPVKCVAMDEEEAVGSCADRRFVVYSGSLDGSVKVWRLSDADAREPALAMEQTAAAPAQPSDDWRSRPSPALYAIFDADHDAAVTHAIVEAMDGRLLLQPEPGGDPGSVHAMHKLAASSPWLCRIEVRNSVTCLNQGVRIQHVNYGCYASQWERRALLPPSTSESSMRARRVASKV
jgi:hypothetical protein